MSVKFDLDYSEVEKLEEKFKRIPVNVENVINSYLHKEGTTKAQDKIIYLMPTSNQKKKHAKTSNPLKSKNSNLGFTIMTKPKFNYLVFPDQALGTSKGNAPQDFMKRGLSKSITDIMDGLNEHIDRYLEEEF